MASITQSKEPTALSSPRFQLDVSSWLRNTIFSSFWHAVFFIFLVIANILIIRTGYTLEPVGLSYNLAPNGQPTALGNFILTITNGALLTSIILILWLIGAALVTYSVATHRWIGPSQWLKDSLYTGPFGALTTLALVLLIVFAIRGILSWAVFGAEFRTDPESVALLRPITPGAIWGVVGANLKLFAVGRYPSEFVWRVWFSLGIVLALGAFSVFAWNFGSPLKRFRQILVWAWLASIPAILFILRGFGTSLVQTNLWGGLLLTIVISVIGIVVSFPIGVLMALGRRSQTRGVPFTWAWGAGLLLIYWGLFGIASEPVTLNIPLIFRDPPVWSVTIAPLTYAALQAIIVIGIFWAIGHYLQGNMIKTFSIVYIEVIRGVPLITVLFMAQIMLPIFLPKEIEIDNLLRVVVGVILFSAAYLAENVRGGLQAIPKGQYEAAVAIGLSNAQSTRLIILPQALRLVIPALVGQCISLFKDTSLVAIVGLFDLLKIAQTVVAQQEWLGLQQETYAFVALVYWVFAFSMSRASQRIEKNLGVGKY
ncbi:MAG TPA: amino acid ABC transporter permease [Anaerolineae bacterium]|nr:amino acid ABC transporter permease [Anaerolineae bacterium]MCB0222132.1 amino acid ABC transporter permease [Anaerolineae bacterium]MCB9103125.1 amino acid ABC transporter permease [Anaerolineales bacterium]HRV93826.1 amino acid ABC transporter permease [Anaerolineae bacterium]